ncbi:hypothetical protein Tco_0689618 [Tanacetum coccineum]
MDLSDYEVPRVLVTCRRLKFGVENWTDYNDEEEPIPFRRRVFSSSDGRPIRGKNVETLIKSEAFNKLDDNDAVSLCCVGILQLVLLGLKDRRHQLKDANVRRWPALYATQPTDEVDKKSYSITGFAWAFKTWILESFRVATNDYYTRYRRLPRIVAWSSKNKFYRHMLKPFLDVIPSEMYREFEEQRRGYKQMMEKRDDMYKKMSRFMEDMRVGPVPQAKKEPIIADQHYGISDLSGFQSNQGVPSSFHMLANSSSFFNMATPSNWQTPIPSNWQTPIPSNWQTPSN